MDSLVLLKTTIILFSSALHLIAYGKENLFVHPMYALDVAVDGMSVFALWELQDLPRGLIETAQEKKVERGANEYTRIKTTFAVTVSIWCLHQK